VGYLYKVDNELKYIYYLVPKCATRTFFSIFNYPKGGFKKISVHHSDYFSWGFVRNPFDRAVSVYLNKLLKEGTNVSSSLGKLGVGSFKDFVLCLRNLDLTCNKTDRHIREQHSFLPEGMDFIGRLENIQEDFNTVCDKIGIPRQELPQKNKTNHKHYAEYYDDEMREIVTEKYAKDIEYFGYEFNS